MKRLFNSILISILAPLTALAAGGDCSSYKIEYSTQFIYTDPLGETVTREKEMTTKDNIEVLLKRAVKHYGVSSVVKRDYSANNIMKLMSPQEQAFLSAAMKGSPYYIATIKFDFKKFGNTHDLEKLFKSCHEKITLACDTKSKACKVSEDEVVCDKKGYLFEDISNTSGNYGISINLAAEHFRKIVSGKPLEEFNLLVIENRRDGGILGDSDGKSQQEILDKLRRLLPETSITTRKNGDESEE